MFLCYNSAALNPIFDIFIPEKWTTPSCLRAMFKTGMAIRVRDAWINAILFPLLHPQQYPGSTCMLLKVVVQSLQALGMNSVTRILTPRVSILHGDWI